MNISLSQSEKEALEDRHRQERDGRIRDRIKAVLLRSEGWELKTIAQAVRMHPETIRSHLEDWSTQNKLKPENGGSESKLNHKDAAALINHLETHTYTKVKDICTYVLDQYSINYTISGMTKWLRNNRFTYKHPKLTPAKADPKKQQAFVEQYLKLRHGLEPDEVLLFADPCHPTMATKVSHGWIRKGKNKLIKQTASRTRQNIMGAIDLTTHEVTAIFPDKVNTASNIEFLKALQLRYKECRRIHLILDNASYNTSNEFIEYAQNHNVVLHHLPTYSPNLNSIERLWPIMNQHVRNNVFFESAKEFRQQIKNFFEKTVFLIKSEMKTKITDNFHILQSVP
jgi:transposase